MKALMGHPEIRGDAKVSNDLWLTLFSGILSAGGLAFIRDLINDFKKSKSERASKQVASVQEFAKNYITLRDELEADNERLRAQRKEEVHFMELERNRYEKERETWRAERREMREEISNLENMIRIERDESDRRAEAILAQLAAFQVFDSHKYDARPEDHP